MKISALYTYPIKSLRGISLPRAELTAQGIRHDRRFMLRRLQKKEGGLSYMGVYHYPRMACFTTAFDFPDEEEDENGEIVVTFYPPPPKEPKGAEAEEEEEEDGNAGENEGAVDTITDRTPREIRIPLEPDVIAMQLEPTEISMHGSNTGGYKMGSKYDKWFSECFGFEVELVYVGDNRRQVLGNLSPNGDAEGSGSWMRSIARSVPLVGTALAGQQHEQGLALADVGALLVLSETSFAHVNRSLPDGLEVDIRKFRPNVVVSGAEEEYEEDYWEDLDIDGKKVLLTQNCSRCVSLNVDFTTGEFCKGPLGKIWANLYKDRRVDPGMKYNPTFGRYGWADASVHGETIAVGDEVTVTGKNTERKTFYWPYKVPS